MLWFEGHYSGELSERVWMVPDFKFESANPYNFALILQTSSIKTGNIKFVGPFASHPEPSCWFVAFPCWACWEVHSCKIKAGQLLVTTIVLKGVQRHSVFKEVQPSRKRRASLQKARASFNLITTIGSNIRLQHWSFFLILSDIANEAEQQQTVQVDWTQQQTVRSLLILTV